jgi:hypothetical protein
MVHRKSRKHSKKHERSTLTIPQLRKSFDHIDSWVETHVTKKSVKTLVPAFQEEWEKTFHREVDAKAAEAYLSLKSRSKPRMTKKRGQRGGAAPLAGAPLDYTTRQGVYGVYGNFPAYVSSGLNFYDSIWQDSLTANCGKENITPNIPASLGSNAVQKGGKSRKYRKAHSKTRKQRGGAPEFMVNAAKVTDVMVNRPFPASSPPTAGYVAQMDLKGVSAGVPSPQNVVAKVMPYDPAALSTSPTVVSANIPFTVRQSVL